jgi:hypothetical protein
MFESAHDLNWARVSVHVRVSNVIMDAEPMTQHLRPQLPPSKRKFSFFVSFHNQQSTASTTMRSKIVDLMRQAFGEAIAIVIITLSHHHVDSPCGLLSRTCEPCWLLVELKMS